MDSLNLLKSVSIWGTYLSLIVAAVTLIKVVYLATKKRAFTKVLFIGLGLALGIFILGTVVSVLLISQTYSSLSQ